MRGEVLHYVHSIDRLSSLSLDQQSLPMEEVVLPLDWNDQKRLIHLVVSLGRNVTSLLNVEFELRTHHLSSLRGIGRIELR